MAIPAKSNRKPLELFAKFGYVVIFAGNKYKPVYKDFKVDQTYLNSYLYVILSISTIKNG